MATQVDAWSHKCHVLLWGCGHSEELDHASHPSPAVEHPTLHPKISHKTNTNHQESHIKRGHPIVFGLILFFALIEGCITAWLGESLLCLTWDDTDEQYPDSTLTTTTPTALTETESVSYFSSLGGLLFSPLDTSLSSSSTLDLSSFPSLPTVSSLLSRKSTVAR
jgi:hypothetical protein